MKFDIVVATNNRHLLNSNLRQSPGIGEHADMHVMEGYASAASAYNAGLAKSSHEIAIFVHQDVYLPSGWFESLQTKIAELERSDPKWGVVGVYGVSTDFKRVGHVFTNGLNTTLGGPFETPVEVQSLDELILILNRKSGLRFDEKLPGFHLYGTDICQIAIEAGKKAYVLDLFCVHNSKSIAYLGPDFWRACSFINRKWRHRLPIQTPCAPLKKGDIYLIQVFAHRLRNLVKKKKLRSSVADPKQLMKLES